MLPQWTNVIKFARPKDVLKVINAPAIPGLSEFLQALSHFYLHKEGIFGNPYSSATVVSICNTLSCRGMAPPSCQFWESFVDLHCLSATSTLTCEIDSTLSPIKKLLLPSHSSVSACIVSDLSLPTTLKSRARLKDESFHSMKVLESSSHRRCPGEPGKWDLCTA